MLTIGEVARRAGLRTSAVRYYEEIGILPPPERVSGRRRYGPDAVERLEVLRFAKSAGLSLDEIRVLFHGFGGDVPPPVRWREVATRKLRELDEQSATIERMRRILDATLDCGCVRIEDCARDVKRPRQGRRGDAAMRKLAGGVLFMLATGCASAAPERDAVAGGAPASAASRADAGESERVGVDTVEVRSDGMVADVFVPAGPGPHPAVLLLGGSGGGIGWQRYMGQLLAERGFVAMGLAYFRMEGLPAELERIPLEYVEGAVAWLRSQPDVDSTRIGVGGVSKGGELALLIASMRPELRAVAAFVPSGYVFQSIAEGFPNTSSWTHRGREVPFVAYGSVASPRSLADYYRAGVAQAESLEAATIRVERINGPVLLLSGEADTLWPSADLSEAVVERLRAHGFAHAVEHVAYPDAGHLISSIYPAGEDPTGRGGTEAGTRHAQVDGQRRFLEFFERNLR